MADIAEVEAAVQSLGESVDALLARNERLCAVLDRVVERTSNALCAVAEEDKANPTYRSAVAALTEARAVLGAKGAP